MHFFDRETMVEVGTPVDVWSNVGMTLKSTDLFVVWANVEERRWRLRPSRGQEQRVDSAFLPSFDHDNPPPQKKKIPFFLSPFVNASGSSSFRDSHLWCHVRGDRAFLFREQFIGGSGFTAALQVRFERGVRVAMPSYVASYTRRSFPCC